VAVCHKAWLGIFGEHIVHCKELSSIKYIHDFIRDIFFDIFKRVGVSMKKKAHVTFLTNSLDRRSTLKHTDVMLYIWVEGKHACVDLTEGFTTCGIRCRAFYDRTGNPKSCVKKMSKHEKTCSHNQHVFIPFSFDIFCFLAPEVVDLPHRVQKVVHNNVMSLRSMNVVFTRIDFVIQKDLMAQLVAHLPSIQV